MTHELKVEPSYFEAVLSGDKTFEIRLNDRGFQKGDTVVLKEYDLGFTTREAAFHIGYVCTFAQKEGWCVFSLIKGTP